MLLVCILLVRFFSEAFSTSLIASICINKVEFNAQDSTDGELSCWTQEGQEVILDASFMYRIQRDKVLDIYE